LRAAWLRSGFGGLPCALGSLNFSAVNTLAEFQSERGLPHGHCPATFQTVSTLAEIECAVTALPRAQQAELLRFIAARLHEASPPAPARTGAELARLWLTQSHLSEDEAEAFERDLAAITAEAAPQAPPAWE